MILSQKVPNLSNICGIALDFSAVPVPSYADYGQPFYDSYLLESNAQSVYFGKRTVSFSEDLMESPAGDYYQIKVSIQFPSNDKERAKRIEEFRKAKFVMVQLNGGRVLLIGRNDFFQNAKPRVKIKSNEQLTAVEFITTSISPTGFLPDYNAGLFPHSIPINFLNAS
ncbi:hypothetical protein [Salinimicrobium sp. WS361]|uniref:hypothetical protein n=1 Tax=Salinimicrobium sp. WS361 TaxID=3425123 RepID=UPI003D6E510E